MAFGAAFFIVILIAVAIWVFIEIKRVRHKIFAIFLIGLIIFTYFTFTLSLNGKNIDFGTTSGWVEAGGLYFSWLSSAFSKAKSVTFYAIGLDWKSYNESVSSDKISEESVWNKLK